MIPGEPFGRRPRLGTGSCAPLQLGENTGTHAGVGAQPTGTGDSVDQREQWLRESAEAVEMKPSVLRNLAAALPLLLLSASYFAAWRLDWLPPGATHRSMTQLLQLEFLALHAGAFLCLVVTWQPVDRAGRRTRWALFAVLLAFYMTFAVRYGWEGALGFFTLIIGTYLGWMLNRRSESAGAGLFARWGAMLLIMLLLVQVLGMPKNVERWINSYGNARLGAWYFLAIGLLEASGIYQHRIWARIAAGEFARRR